MVDIFIGQRLSGVINGTPGVGMTTFGVYVLLRLLQARKHETVVWVETAYYLIFKGGRVTRSTGMFDPWKAVSLHWVLYNAVKPYSTIPARVNVLLFTSPKREIWFKFAKQPSAATWYMPLWEWPELCDLRAKCLRTESRGRNAGAIYTVREGCV